MGCCPVCDGEGVVRDWVTPDGLKPCPLCLGREYGYCVVLAPSGRIEVWKKTADQDGGYWCTSDVPEISGAISTSALEQRPGRKRLLTYNEMLLVL